MDQDQAAPTEEEIQAGVEEIARRLGETEAVPRQQIERIIRYCGIKYARRILRKTYEVEANGGLLTHNRERRRTVGGVFFFFAKRRMAQTQFEKVFPGMQYPYADKTRKKKKDKQHQPKQKKQKKTQQDQAPAEPKVEAAPLPTLPDDAPASAVEKYRQLASAADTFRKKIAGLEAKPKKQQFGLDMTRKLLANTEKQIEALVKQYSGDD